MSWTDRLKKEGMRRRVDVRLEVLKWIRQVKRMNEARMIKRKYVSNVEVVGMTCTR